MSVDLSLICFTLQYKIHKQKKLKSKNNSLIVRIFFNLQNYPIFHSEERLVILERGRECFVGLSILFVTNPPLNSYRKKRLTTAAQL